MNTTEYVSGHISLLANIDISEWNNGIDVVREAFLANRYIYTMGNGGSAYAASHYITDWNKMVRLATGKQFRGTSLCDNIGLISAYGNDIAFEEIFAGQLKSVLAPNDLVIAISGSGNSPNVVRAIEYANAHGAVTLGIVGYDGGMVKKISRHCVHVPSNDMQFCEDFHLMFGHMVMKTLCSVNR